MLMVEADLQAAIEQLGDIDDRVSEALRNATLAGARLIYNEIQFRAPQSERGHWFYQPPSGGCELKLRFVLAHGH